MFWVLTACLFSDWWGCWWPRWCGWSSNSRGSSIWFWLDFDLLWKLENLSKSKNKILSPFFSLVFDVDIGDGEPIRKLPYNRSGTWMLLLALFYYKCNHKKLLQFLILQIFSCLADNPYDAADKWLLKENLPFAYRQQIVEFILQNSGQKDFNFNPSFRDPFTGGIKFLKIIGLKFCF